MKKIFLTASCILFAGTIAMGDWDEGDPAKWAQMPDMSANGLDVWSSTINPDAGDMTLADDFECRSTGRVTDLHFWGSWYHDLDEGHDIMSQQGPGFVIRFLSDIPAEQSATGHSMPGEVLWTDYVAITEVGIQEWSPGPISGGFYTPIISTDDGWVDENETIFQYNIHWPGTGFQQTGTADNPQVYWVSIQAIVLADPAFYVWGWHSSNEHWNDDAVSMHQEYSSSGLNGDWEELRYPTGPGYNSGLEHPLAGDSIDLAFVIVPEPGTIGLLLLGGLALRRRRRA